MATSRGASSSKGRATYSTFNPNWGPEMYKTENLESFIRTAGVDAYDRYKDVLDNLKLQIFARAGATTPGARQELARTGEYRKELQRFRYDTVMRLYNEGAIGSLDDISQSVAAASSISGAREISIADIHAKLNEYNFTRQNPSEASLDAILNWVRAQVATGFKANALEELARQTNVRGFSVITGADGRPAKADEKKQILYNMIVAQLSGTGTGMEGGVSGAATAAGVTPAARSGLQAELARRNISSAGSLTSLNVPELRALAKQFNIPSSGKKAVLINALANALGFEGLPAQENIKQRVDRLITLARQNPAAAEEEARAMGADVLSMASGDALRQLGSLLQARARFPGIRGALTQTQIIEALTGTRPAAARSRERREAIRTSRDACVASDPAEVVAVARAQGINVVGMSQAEICNALFGRYLANMSNLIFGRAQTGELERIAGMAGEQQMAALRTLSGQIGVSDVRSLDDLLNRWLEAHYVARALQLRPEAEADVRAFLRSGTIPDDLIAQADLAVIFADLDRALAGRMAAADRERALRTLYQNFVQRFQMGQGMAAIRQNAGRLGGVAMATTSRAETGASNGSRSPRSPRANPLAGMGAAAAAAPRPAGNGGFNVAASNPGDLRGFATTVYSLDEDAGGNGGSRGRGDLVVSQGVMNAVNRMQNRYEAADQLADIQDAFIPDAANGSEGTRMRGSATSSSRGANQLGNNRGGRGASGAQSLTASGAPFGSSVASEITRSARDSFGPGNGAGLII